MSFPTLPDSVYKLFVYLGIGLMVYAFISRQNEYVEFENQRLEYNSKVRRLDNQREQLNVELKSINADADFYSKRFSIPNPLIVSDSGYSFNQTIRGDEKSVALSDTISHILTSFRIKKKQIAEKDAELGIQRYIIDEKGDDFKQIDDFSIGLAIIGCIVFLVGLSIWINNEKEKENILHRQNLSLPTFSNCCQSCGIVFDRTTKFGTEVNGNTNYNFCIRCYSNGKYAEPNITVSQIVKTVQSDLGIKFSIKEERKFEKKIRRLDRWKLKRYL